MTRERTVLTRETETHRERNVLTGERQRQRQTEREGNVLTGETERERERTVY